MKRWIGSLVLSGIAAMAMSQAPFTIVRPADGSRVREKVHILIPKGSVPPGGYVGVFLNDQLLEAVVPKLAGKYYEYVLDTKGRGLADTPEGKTEKLELVLYTFYDEKARIVDRSSVNIRIGNQANIPVSNSGIKLRYKFVPGKDMIYDLEQKIQVSPMTGTESENGGKAATFDTDAETLRLLYSVVNTYEGGDGLLRLQALPLKGKNYADMTATGETEQKRYSEEDMAPLYMRVTTTGKEVFGALPAYFGFESTSGSVRLDGLLAAFPLPTLPQKAVSVGDSWPSRFQEGSIDLGNWVGVNTLVKSFPARGEFANVEWESGHPCARIKNTIEVGTESLDAKKDKDKATPGDKVGVQETIWFALDTHQILKIQRDMTIDRQLQSATSTPGAGGMPMGPMGPMGPGAPMGMPPGAGGGMRGKGGDDFTGPINNDQMQMGRGRGGRGRFGGGAPGGFPGGFPGAGGGMPGGFGGGRNGAASVQQATFVRIHILQTFTLEK